MQGLSLTKNWSIACMSALSTKFIIDLESKFVKTWGRSLAQPRVRPIRVCLQTKSCQHKTWQIFSSYLLSSSLRLSVPPASCVLQTNGGSLSASVQRWSLRHSTIHKLVLVFEIVKQPFYCVLLYVIFFSHVWINLCSSFTCYKVFTFFIWNCFQIMLPSPSWGHHILSLPSDM